VAVLREETPGDCSAKNLRDLNPASQETPRHCSAKNLRDLNPASQETPRGVAVASPRPSNPARGSDTTTVVAGTAGAGAPGDMQIPALRMQGA